jgi:hypothetical protein
MDRGMRQTADKALDAMAIYIPPQDAVRVLTEKGVNNKIVSVRRATARLLTVIVKTSGADSVLGRIPKGKFKRQVIRAVAKFLQDKDPETRHHAQDLVKFLMTELTHSRELRGI